MTGGMEFEDNVRMTTSGRCQFVMIRAHWMAEKSARQKDQRCTILKKGDYPYKVGAISSYCVMSASIMDHPVLSEEL